MNKIWRQRLRKLRLLLGGLLCAGLITLAVLMALVQGLLPLVAHYPDRVASMLGARLQQPVRFASMDGHWHFSGPLLVLHDVRIGGVRDQPLHLPAVEVKLDLGALLLPRRSLLNLRVMNLRLDLNRGSDGAWSVVGFAARHGSKPSFDLHQLPGNLLLSKLQVNIHDARSGGDWHLYADALRVNNNGTVLRFAGDVRRPGVEHGLTVIGRLDIGVDSGAVYVAGHDIDLHRLMSGIGVAGYAVHAGSGDLQWWLRWRHARVVAQTARVGLRALDMHGPIGRTELEHVRGLFDFQRGSNGWVVRYVGEGDAAVRVDIAGAGAAKRVEVRARRVELQHLLPLVAQLPSLSPSLVRWLLASRPHGTLDRVELRWSAAHGLQHMDGTFSHLIVEPVAATPGIGSLHGRVFADSRALLLELPQQRTTVRMPGTFRKPIVLRQLQGDVALWHDTAAWHLATTKLDFGGQGFSGQARGTVDIPVAGGKPFLRLFAAVQQVDVQAAKQFWPVNAMSAGTVKWLDRSLLSGHLTQAKALFRGDLADWPFRTHEGRFEAHGDIADLALDYNPKWPRAEAVHAVASFVDDSMLVRADAGYSRGNKVSMAVASIPSFHNAKLILNVQGNGTGTSMLDFARNSPIAAAEASALRRLTLGGRGNFNFGLVLPFKHSKAFTLAGNVHIKGVDVDNQDWGLTLGKLTGNLSFDGHGLRGKNLKVQFNGTPSRFDLAVGSGATGNSRQLVGVAMRGHYTVATLVQGRPSLTPLIKLASGHADFDIGFDIMRVGAEDLRQTLRVDSLLQGIAFNLPTPLDKLAASRLPLHLRLQLPVSGGDLHVSLGSLVQAWARLPTDDGSPLALAVMLGNKRPTTLPARGIRIQGHGAELDVSGWLQRAMADVTGKNTEMELAGVDVRADRAKIFSAMFRDLHLALVPQSGQIMAHVDAPQIKGSVMFPTSNLQRRGILLRLQRLYWPDDTDTSAASNVGALPAEVNHADTGIDPASLPPLHLTVADLRLGKAHLGTARFESWPNASGMHIDQLRTRTNDVQITASGDWQGSMTDSHTHMGIDFGAENLGRLLKALGFNDLFEGGRTRAQLDATWPGEPTSLALQRMHGALGVQVSKGRIPKVQQGVGRLFGLMALTELPRRLALDFGDVFGKGLWFDSIKGRFRLGDGVARIDELKMKSSAANISITGRTNLRDKTYDQHILVVPHVGNSLPVVGALAGGAVGAAAGLAMQGLLGRGLNKAASVHYRLTGNWDMPKLTLVEKTVKQQTLLPPTASTPAPATATSSPP